MARRCGRLRSASPCTGLRLQAEGISPGPVEATVTVTDKSGHLVGQLDLDARDGQWMADAISAMAVCVSALSAPNVVTLFQTPVRRVADQTLGTAVHGLQPPVDHDVRQSMPIKENRPHRTTARPARRRATTSSRRQGAGAAEQRGRARGRGVPGPLAAQTSQVPFHRPSTGWRSGHAPQ
jgi:hypothetical protein